jgi:KDO2-lipid IV(A) lauroyltransferase
MKMNSSTPKMGLGAWALWIFCRSVAILPHWVQYNCIGKAIYFILRYVVRYRRKLIIRQLTESFPERSEKEIATLCTEYYHTLAQTFVGTMTLAAMSEKKKQEVLDVTVPEEILEAVKGKHFIHLSSHHNFWEFALFVGLKFTGHITLCAYHPLTSKAWDELYYHLRHSKDAIPVPSSQLIRYFLQHRKDGVDGRQLLLGLIADQNAPPMGEVHWYDFLNHKTIFFEGGEQMALKFGMPVLYLSMSKVATGRYKGEVIMLYDGVESVEKHEITERYVQQLERDILREPAAWMWSHRRWKYYPDPVTGEPIYKAR